VWSNELDSGGILLIETVKIDKEYRRLGLGKRIVAEILDKAREKTDKLFAFAWPLAYLPQ
jgi:GNAT superfamily N-acetyltransferase